MRTSEYEAGDRWMSGWVASCVHNGTRIFVTEEGRFTTRADDAAWHRYWSDADRLARATAVAGFPMEAETVAAVASDIP
jgi:hypothetical protein